MRIGHLALALALGAPAACGPGPPSRPSILLVVIDTLRADHLGAYGYERPTSPALDALAADATLYRRAYSQAPWTTPSVGSLLTSQYPSALGLRDLRSRLPEEALLLSELLKDQGYATAAVVSHTLLTRKWGFRQGFAHFDESGVFAGGVSSPLVTERAVEQLDAFARDSQPFFLFLHYFDPHFEYVEHADFAFGGADASYAGPVRSNLPMPLLRQLEERARPADLAELDRIYASEVAFTDAAIGHVLARLRELGLYDDTLVIVTGDHGEEFLDHGSFGHTKTLYEELLRVPLIIKYPRRDPAQVDTPVALVDVVPTVADVLDVAPAAPLVGRSLLALDPDAARPIFAETSRGAVADAVIFGRYKLIRHPRRGEERLYDVVADPGERVDLSAREPERVSEMRELLERWRGANRGAEPATPPLDLDATEREHLRALGYVEDGS